MSSVSDSITATCPHGGCACGMVMCGPLTKSARVRGACCTCLTAANHLQSSQQGQERTLKRIVL